MICVKNVITARDLRTCAGLGSRPLFNMLFSPTSGRLTLTSLNASRLSSYVYRVMDRF